MVRCAIYFWTHLCPFFCAVAAAFFLTTTLLLLFFFYFLFFSCVAVKVLSNIRPEKKNNFNSHICDPNAVCFFHPFHPLWFRNFVCCTVCCCCFYCFCLTWIKLSWLGRCQVKRLYLGSWMNEFDSSTSCGFDVKQRMAEWFPAVFTGRTHFKSTAEWKKDI